MKQPTYPIKTVCRHVATCIRAGTLDNSATSIRCAINDILDSLSRDGWTVRHDYDQERAIKTVRKLVGEL